ncbi:MAG TPA: class I SAM-dependent methyltransferase [Chitinophagaceae bacterium]|nr:class I SAM-dependent methyltransferase [Chitinophagaceae bacterium]
MKINIKAQNLLEWIGKKTNQVPIPLAHTHIFSFVSRALYDAAHLGVFEALETGPDTEAGIALRCHLDPAALGTLLGLTTALGYTRYRRGKYALTRMTRKWLLDSSPASVRPQLLFMREIWSWLEALPRFLETGQGMDFHTRLNTRQWELYQAGMRSIARGSAWEVAAKTPLPPHPALMLDIGGSHGILSAAICQKHPGLESRILDLPEAVEQARPILQRDFPAMPIQYLSGDALEYELGENCYDLVFVSSLLHHFNEEQNRTLCARIARALKPGGYFVVQEFIRPAVHRNADLIGMTLALFFNLSSNGRTWSIEEIRSWQSATGLELRKSRRLITMPGFSQIVSQKPS